MLSTQQQAAVDAVLTTSNNLALVARAGCGKTFTILQMIKAYTSAYPSKEVIVAAYNTAIKDEVKGKLAEAGYNWRRVQAATAHSLGFQLLKFQYKSVIDDKKVQKLIEEQAVKSQVCADYGTTIKKMVDIAKQSGVGFFPEMPIEDFSLWADLSEYYGIDGLEDVKGQDSYGKIIAVAQWVYRCSNANTAVVDFNDMILLPLIYGLKVKFAKDLVFVDEAQDLSRTRQALLRRFVKPNTGRMVVVGDDRQAIYGFSGADPDALPRMIAGLDADILPLNVTWRCPKSVVALAQRYVLDFEAADTAATGEVLYLDKLPSDIGPNDAILCRNTLPLIKTAYTLLASGIGCRVEGRDIGESLCFLAKRWRAKTTDALLNRLDAYEEREVNKAVAKQCEGKAESIRDQVGALRAVIAAVNSAGKTSVADVLAFINSLFLPENGAPVLTLATYHRSKGREWDRVILLEHNLRCPSKWAKQPHERLQEDNLAYVAFTRAKHTLIFLS